MTDFVETMKLAEKAQEDIYFAKIDRELIEAMHRRAAERVAAEVASGKTGGAESVKRAMPARP